MGLGNGLNAYLNVGRIGRDAPPFVSFRKERPWSLQQVSELSLPGLMSDN